MKRKETIKKWQNGEIQIFNDLLPSTKEIKKLLKEGFPDDNYLDKNKAKTLSEVKFYANTMNGKWQHSFDGFASLPIVNLSSISKGKKKLKEKLIKLEKDVAELKAKDWGSIVPSEKIEVENVKPKKKSGWYKDMGFPKWLMFLDYENKKCYGFDSAGDWYEGLFEIETSICNITQEVLATPEEVLQALIEEAKKRGFGDVNYGMTLDYCLYIDNGNRLKNIFSGGVWEEIIDQPKEEAIDWSIPQRLKGINNDTLVMTNGISTEHSFQAYVINLPKGAHRLKIHRLVKCFDKKCFEIFKGTLTINQ